MNKYIKTLRYWFDYKFYRYPIDRGMVIVRFDGGICSQIAFWAIGKSFSDAGFKVKYDLSWYVECGTDMAGHHVRNFDLSTAFPGLNFEVANNPEIYFYKKNYAFSGKDVTAACAPLYLGGYYDFWPLVLKYKLLIHEQMRPGVSAFSSQDNNLLSKIRGVKNSCAVHIRRGDLSTYNPAYGEPVDPDYFVKAMLLVEGKAPKTTYFLFSDDADWVAKNIVPRIPDSMDFEMACSNGAEKGYMDLYLMAQCNSFISSQGSLAKYARVLSSNSDALIVEPKSRAIFPVAEGSNSYVI